MIQENIKNSFGKGKASTSPVVYLEPPVNVLSSPPMDRQLNIMEEGGADANGLDEIYVKFVQPVGHKQQHTFTSDLNPELKFLMFDPPTGTGLPEQQRLQEGSSMDHQQQPSFSSLQLQDQGLAQSKSSGQLTDSSAISNRINLDGAFPQVSPSYSKQGQNLPAHVLLDKLVRSGLKPELSMASLLAQANLEGQQLGHPSPKPGQVASSLNSPQVGPLAIPGLDSLHSQYTAPGMERQVDYDDYALRVHQTVMQQADPIRFSQPYPESSRPAGESQSRFYQPFATSGSGFEGASGTGELYETGYRLQEGEIVPSSGPSFSPIQEEVWLERQGRTRLHEEGSFQPSVPDLTTRRMPPDLMPFLASQQAAYNNPNMVSMNGHDTTGFPEGDRQSKVIEQGTLPTGSQHLGAGSQFLAPAGSQFQAAGSQFPHPGGQFPLTGSQFLAAGSQVPLAGTQFSPVVSQFPPVGSQLPRVDSFSNLMGQQRGQESPLSPMQTISNVIGGEVRQQGPMVGPTGGSVRQLEPMQPIVKHGHQLSSSFVDNHGGRTTTETKRQNGGPVLGNTAGRTAGIL